MRDAPLTTDHYHSGPPLHYYDAELTSGRGGRSAKPATAPVRNRKPSAPAILGEQDDTKRMAEFEASVTISAAAETVFDFLLRPANLERISPPDMAIRFLDAPERIEHGHLLEFDFDGFGMVQRIVHEIITLEPPLLFTERQVTGPLKRWVHEHRVEPVASGEVLVVDRIEFEPPGGLLGMMLTESRIVSTLREGFEHRHRELRRLLETDAS